MYVAIGNVSSPTAAFVRAPLAVAVPALREMLQAQLDFALRAQVAA